MEIKEFSKIEYKQGIKQEINQEIECDIKLSNGITAVYKGKFDTKNRKILDGTIGAIKYENKYIFMGRFKDNKLNEMLALKFPDGSFLKGNLEFDKPIDEDRMIVRSNGTIEKIIEDDLTPSTTGYFSDEKLQGKGTIIYPDGSSFEGIFNDGQPMDGHGVIVISDGTVFKTVEDGKFKNGKLQGKGAIIYSNGTTEMGEFENLLLKDGEMKIKFTPEQPELCYCSYKDNKITKLKYFYYEDNQKYEIEVDYNIINQSLNKGSINNFEDLLKTNPEGLQAIKILDSGGNDITGKKDFELVKKCSKQILNRKFENTNSNVGFEGSTIELNNLFLLANLKEVEDLKRIRFSSRYNENTFKDVESFLNSFYITTNEEKSKNNPNFTYIKDDRLKTTDHFSTSIALQRHAIASAIDLKKIKEGSLDKIFYGLDSERMVGDLESYPNAIKNNSKFYNHNQQRLGSCWYNSICSVKAISENPEIINKIRDNEIKPIGQNDVEMTEKTEINELEILQMQKLQEFAKSNGFERVGEYENNKKHKHQFQNANRQIVLEEVRNIIKAKVRKDYEHYKALGYIRQISELEKEKIGFNTALNNYAELNNLKKMSNKIQNSAPQRGTFLSGLLEKREKAENNKNNQITI